MQVKFLFSLHLTLLSGLLFAQTPEPMRLHIHFSDASEGYLFIRNLLKPVPDTVRFTNNTCSYTADITETTPFVLTDESNKYQLFFAAPGDQLEVQMKRHDMQLTAISGSASMDIYKKLLMMQGPVQQRMEGLQQLAMQEHANRDSIQTLMSAVGNEQNKNFFRFLQENGRSPVSAFLVYSSISNIHSIDANTADSMFQWLKGDARQSFFGKETAKSIEKLKSVTVGYTAPDFTVPDSSGKLYSLRTFRGHYLLVDFWASWCGPCKGEIPYLKEAYTRFHDKGFRILSVSLDDKRDAWMNALHTFQMPWPQVSDVNGFHSVVNELYPIPSIPKTLLLDPEGKIIATDLRGHALDQRLEQLLK